MKHTAIILKRILRNFFILAVMFIIVIPLFLAVPTFEITA